jgi:predicted secreted protein
VAKVRLARSQSITADGIVLLGTRDFDIDLELDTVDVTRWDSAARGELTLTEMNTITLQIYHVEDVRRFMRKWNKFPPEPVTIALGGASANFVVTKLKLSGQFGGVLAYEVVLKLWPFI